MLKIKFQEVLAQAVENQKGHVSSLAFRVQRASDTVGVACRKKNMRLRKNFNLSSPAKA